MLKPQEKLFYILHPRSATNVVDGHCLETDALLLAAGKWTSQLHNEIFVFDNGHWEKSTELYKSVAGASWSDVILSPDMKQGLIEDVQGFFDNQAVYKEFAVPWKRGIILHGVPGNGKTVSIKALMSSLNARSDSIPSMYVKSFETNCNTQQYSIRQIFQKARSVAPCLLIFEDLDSLVGDNIRSFFLNEVDGLESNDGILMIGSTNHLDRLDPAISKRPSRFDRKYHFKIPGMEERSLYAEYWRGKLAGKGTVDFPEDLVGVVAALTEGFSFAYLKELFVMALLTMVRGGVVDESEMEEVNEEAGADDKVAEKPEKPEEKQQDDVCTCAKKCKDCDKPLSSSTTASVDEGKKLDESTKKSKAVMPAVDIPPHLSNNVLLKVIKHQIRILHAEMDNTKDDVKPSVKISVAGAGDDNRAAMARLTIANARRSARG
jgi:transitional endoplasmic reticulum ATPase